MSDYTLADWLYLDIHPEAKVVGIEMVRFGASYPRTREDLSDRLSLSLDEVEMAANCLKQEDIGGFDDNGKFRMHLGCPWAQMLSRPGFDVVERANAAGSVSDALSEARAELEALKAKKAPTKKKAPAKKAAGVKS